ncbi:cytochrome P450 [Halosolutus amylolyticus]|uniref:Cytochrome P450 n=1 Tax=Halosolutus amylolyticus TaxID=2932267 RepID=A0ABD5PU76_9EURY|nr:cytochrome P450 [Halosolutus amylolyticus]
MVARHSADDRHAESADGEPAIDDAPLPPGPDGYPIVGNTIPVVRDPFDFYETIAEYGDVVRYEVAGRSFTALLTPEHVERVLVEEPWRFERWEFADVGLDFAPEGLLSSDREQWQGQRQLMQPMFTTDRIRSYADAMAGYADRVADEWSDGQTLALDEAFSELTLAILSKTLFDLELDPTAADGAIPRAARAINERTGPERNLTMFVPDWVPTPGNRRYNRAMRDVDAVLGELIERRRSSDRDADDLLSLLLTATGPDGYELSEAEIRDNLLTFMFAGHETTALGLTYTIMLLATHDDVAADLRAELDDVLDGETPGIEHVSQLERTERVIREALRLYPPVFILFRRATEDAVFDGYRVPEGTILTFPQFHVHTDDRFYDDPEAFRPDRWTDERAADRPEYAYFPFGGGPRHCIGMRFATLELQLVVATLARRFEFELLSDSDPEFAAGATLRPAEPVRVRVHER